MGRNDNATPGATSQWINTIVGNTTDTFQNPNQAADRSALQNLYNQIQNQHAPQMASANAGGPSQAQGSTLGPTNTVQGTNAGNAAQAGAAQGQSTNANAANAGNAALSRAANINTANANQDRGGTQALVNQLAGIANGSQAGMGQAQFQQSQAQNVAAAIAAAQSGRTGQNPNLVARNTAASLANSNSAAAAQAAQIAMQQQQNAQSQLGSNLANLSNQDIGLASNQAQLQQQTGLANQGALNAQNALNAGYQQAANLQNAAAANQMTAANVAARNTANLANQAATNQMAQYNATNAQNANLSNQSQINAMLQAQAQLAQQNSQYNATNAQNMAQYNATNAQNMALANMQALQNNQQMQDQYAQNILGGINNLDQQSVANQEAAVQAVMGQEQVTNNFDLGQSSQITQGITSGIGALGGLVGGLALLSDERKKKKKKSANQQIEDLLDAMTQISDMNLKTAISTNFNNNPFNQFQTAPQVTQMAQPNSNMQQGMYMLGKGLAKQFGSQQPQAPSAPTPQTPAPTPPGYQMPGTVKPGMSDFTAPEVGSDATAGYSGMLGMNPAMGADAGEEAIEALSDEREKTGTQTVNGALNDMLDNLKAYSYYYKDPSQPGASEGKQLGIMAQDLERSDAGKLFVKESPEGVKMVQYGKMLPTYLAMLANQHGRIKKLEARD